ncbi:SNF12 [Enterospora canceri]|uniref:SNF12 n=1 Tax=Enterospora canceri TaxID=1081671 RepID=A0A1Y1S4W5_9MICR|nr:SNF12 [Enterospora canceri]
MTEGKREKRTTELNRTDEKFEKLDQVLNKIALEKRLLIEAEHLKRIKKVKTIRFYCALENDELKVHVRILNNFTGELKAESTSLWELIKRIVVVADGSIHEWTVLNKCDAFLVKGIVKTGGIRLLVKLQNGMNLFKFSKELSELLGIYAESKANAVKEIYKYVSAENLLNHNTGFVTCNEPMHKIFKKDEFDFNDIGEMLECHFMPLEYLKIDLGSENGLEMFDLEVECDDVTQMPILYTNEVKMLSKKIESNKIIEKRIRNSIDILDEFIKNPLRMMARYLIMEKDIKGIKTKYFEDLNIQSALFELLHNKN